MTQEVAFDLFSVSLVVLLLVLMILLVFCWILRNSRTRTFTELKISAGQPARILTIRTEPQHAQQLLDRLLAQVFLPVEPQPETEGEPGAEPGGEPDEDNWAGEFGLDCESEPDVSTAASFPSRAVSVFHNKLREWIRGAVPSTAPSPPSPTDGGENSDLHLQQLVISQHPSVSSEGYSCSANEEEQYHDSQL